ncbi:type II secretion system F family protein [Nevskia sp.]|uniref:type II secretion system F family protein n=1 Tax=Nevskia sp. TaxID=1929292 RepID=UPI0025D41BF2|nr:type II secretion system F family protein [Nevskia sp.]
MNLIVLVFVLAAVLLLGGSVWLFSQAREKEQEADLKLRLRVSGSDEAAIAQGSTAIRNPLLRSICHLFWRTGSDIRPGAVIRLLLIIAASALLLGLMIGPLYTVPLVGVFLLLFYMVLVQKAVWRRRKIVDQLPSYLENVIRVLAAGNTLDEALSQAAREAPNPIQPLFTSISRQVRLGALLEQVLSEAGDIHRLRDLKVMAMAASINRKYGGSMRGVLKSLIVLIRQRASAAQELRALTAETRFSAKMLAGINILLFGYMYWSNPRYYEKMLADPKGGLLLIGSGTMLFLGFIALWWMLKGIDEGDS